MGIVRSSEICLILFGESFASNWVSVIVREDASSTVVGHVDVVLVADVSEVEAANYVSTDSFNLERRRKKEMVTGWFLEIFIYSKYL